MRKFALIAVMLLSASLTWGEAAAARRAKARPVKPVKSAAVIRAELIARADKFEAAGQYELAAKTARTVLAGSVTVLQKRQLFKQLRRLAWRQGVARRLARLEASMKARPDDMAIRERVIKLCLIELDNPVLAGKYVNEDVDQVLQTYIPLAAGKLEKLTDAPCLELGRWYLSNIKNTSHFARITILQRAARYYGRFLELHTTVDAEQRQAAEQYKLLIEQLTQLGETLPKTS
ncbi:MAG: hypothetical protein HN350_03640 [Phycisphaerales bacterium]|jgi:hypothetical protein|nr:hypothetical protein [Phycisphaerales bacterium]